MLMEKQSFETLRTFATLRTSKYRVTSSLTGCYRVRWGLQKRKANSASLSSRIHTSSLTLARKSEWFTPNSPVSGVTLHYTLGVADAGPSWFSLQYPLQCSYWGLRVAWTHWFTLFDHHSQACCVVTIILLWYHFSFLGCFCCWIWASTPSAINCLLNFPIWWPTLLAFKYIALVFIALPHPQIWLLLFYSMSW